MNPKQAKRIKRKVKKESKKIIQKSIKEIQAFPFRERLKFCWFILKGK